MSKKNKKDKLNYLDDTIFDIGLDEKISKEEPKEHMSDKSFDIQPNKEEKREHIDDTIFDVELGNENTKEEDNLHNDIEIEEVEESASSDVDSKIVDIDENIIEDEDKTTLLDIDYTKNNIEEEIEYQTEDIEENNKYTNDQLEIVKDEKEYTNDPEEVINVEEDSDNQNKSKFVFIIIGIFIFLVIVFLLIKGCTANKKYTIKFDTNGGNNITEQVIDKNSKVSEPKVPVKEGYKFIGWYVNGKKYDFSTKINEDFIIEARWEKVDVKVTSVTLDQTEVTIKIGATIQLNVNVTPENATEKNVTWTSSNKSIATVDENGVVTGNKKGVSIITVTTKDGNLISNCKITVTDNVISVKGISLDKTSTSLKVGSTIKLVATVKPKNASNKGVTWSSSDKSIATVENGQVKGLKAGKVEITATTKDGNYKAKTTITVSDITPTAVTLDKTSLNMIIGDTYLLKATVKPTNAANKDVVYSSSNNNIASVDNRGLIKAKAVGDAIVTVKTVDGGKKATVKVHVSKLDVTGVSLNKTSLTLDIGATETLTAKITPDNATIKTVTWKTSNDKVATVNQNGKITAIGSGKANITVTTSDGNKIATCAVTVNNPTIKFNNDKATVYVGDEYSISYTLKPANLNITWVSSKTSIGTVSAGKFKALSAGSTNVTGTVSSNGVTASAKIAITVNKRVIINMIKSGNPKYPYKVDSVTIKGAAITLTTSNKIVMGKSTLNVIDAKGSKLFYDSSVCTSAVSFIHSGQTYSDVTVKC